MGTVLGLRLKDPEFEPLSRWALTVRMSPSHNSYLLLGTYCENEPLT